MDLQQFDAEKANVIRGSTSLIVKVHRGLAYVNIAPNYTYLSLSFESAT